MNKKIIFQIFILLIIFFFIALLFYQYSLNEKPQTTVISKDIINSNLDEKSSNIMRDIEYKSYDTMGNQYQITAKLGTISDENPNLILMQNVSAEIHFNDHEKIYINALFATYNVVNYDTIFEDEIDIKYAEHSLNCDNANLLFGDQKIKLYNNINYTNLNTSLLADEIEIDLTTKNLKIYMIDENQKIKAIFKSNVPN
tara:strand:- start:1293 stop:1889 length:597 start_codon:yes stop_codon:yes gene_type:complete